MAMTVVELLRDTTGVPCLDCGGPVMREVGVDGHIRGRGHHRCRDCRERNEAEETRRRAEWKASMRHPVKHRYIGLVKVPVTCACGCGEAINADTIKILEYRDQGLSYQQIALTLNKNRDACKQRVRSMPLYAKGHVNHASREWTDLPCHRCGKPVFTPKSTRFPHCKGWCVPPEEFWAANYNAFDEKERIQRERERANTSAADALIAPHRERRREERIREYEARLRERQIQRAIREAEWHAARERRALDRDERAQQRLEKLRLVEQLELARRNAIRPGSIRHWEQLGVLDEEVAALLAEQKRDERANRIQYDQSLDVRFDGNDDGSWAAARVGGVSFDRDEDKWPYFAEQGRRPRTRVS